MLFDCVFFYYESILGNLGTIFIVREKKHVLFFYF